MSRFLNSSSMSATEAARGLTLILIGCCLVQLPAVAADIAFVGAQVVDVRSGTILDGQTVLISDQQTMVGLATVGEMKALRDVGMSNADVLRAATMEPANYLGRSGELGELREGAVADLILIGGNPLQDLDALGHIFGVMTEGIWYDHPELDRMLEEVATKSAGGTH